MKLTALDIRKQEFKRSMRGYDTHEVRVFLEMVSAQWESMASEIRECQNRLIELETQLKDYRQVEKVMHQTMLTAEETSKQLMENARNQSATIIREAELKAMQIMEAAKQDIQDLRSQISILQSNRTDILNRLYGLINLIQKNLDDFRTTGTELQTDAIASEFRENLKKAVSAPTVSNEKSSTPVREPQFVPVTPVQKPEKPTVNLDNILNQLD